MKIMSSLSYLVGKVAPWRASAGDPKDRVDELALIAAVAAAALWDEGKDEGPFLVGQGVAIFSHEGLWHIFHNSP